MDLVTEVYRATRVFPRDELYGLTSQLRRTAVSVPSNIAEGQARFSHKEFHHLLSHARGSLVEIETQLMIAQNLGYLSAEQSGALLSKAAELGRGLNGLIASTKSAA
jgi:four helix bundle protein